MVEFAYHLGGILAIRNWPFYKGKCQKVGLICKALYFAYSFETMKVLFIFLCYENDFRKHSIVLQVEYILNQLIL